MSHCNDARIFRVNPERVIVGVRAGQPLPGLTAIERHLRGRAADKQFLVVQRVDTNLAEVRRTLILIAHERPGLAAVFGSKHAAAVGIWRRRRIALTARRSSSASAARSCGTWSGGCFSRRTCRFALLTAA